MRRDVALHAPPGACSMASSMASVEPLPLVPAMCTTGGSRRSGLPSAPSRRSMRLEREIDDLGWSAVQPGEDQLTAKLVTALALAPLLSTWTRPRGCLGSDGRRPACARARPALASGSSWAAAAGGAGAARGAQLEAMHHHVDHAVLEQVLRALEAFGQLLADRLLDHRAGRRSRSGRRARRSRCRPAWRTRR